MPQRKVAGHEASEARVDRAAHPRPQFVRDRWLSLDGRWSFAIGGGRDGEATGDAGRPKTGGHAHAPEAWPQEILVPFAPEAPLSGIGDTGFHEVLWYRRSFEVPQAWRDARILLHFGAVDYHARVWLNGALVAEHEGGHTPFSADITDALREGVQELIVRADDDPFDLEKPRGKQAWEAEPHDIWYPRTSGIWQSVWLEPVPPTRLAAARITPRLADLSLAIAAEVEGAVDGLELEVTLAQEGITLGRETWPVTGRTASGRLQLRDRDADDAHRRLAWSPETPRLLDVTLQLRRGDRTLDRVLAYTALRDVEARDGRFLLNGRPTFLRLALDQGYWRDGLMSAPDADALRRDVELARQLGFNGVRKHQKLEDPRYLYWADRLGLLVWAELPSARSFSERAVARLAREWMEAIARDANHPCVVAWVAFNESWGVPDLPDSARQREAVRALSALARALDGTRPVIGNDGWEYVVGDLFTIHDYAAEPETLERRYGSREALARTVAEERPGGRALLAEAGVAPERLPVVLSEFGGVLLRDGGRAEEPAWGYSEATSPADFLSRYAALVRAASSEALAGFCYTQLYDTFQEQNGLSDMGRRPKADPDTISRATRAASE